MIRGSQRVSAIAKNVRSRFKRRSRPWAEEQSEFWYRLFEILFDPVFKYWIRYFRAIGSENVPAEGALFLLCNHTTGMDPFLLGYALPHRRINGPGKVELFKNPLVAYIMRRIGIFPISREAGDAGAVRTMVSLYRAGRLVVIYPEGTRSETQQLLPFNPGVARLLIKLRAPIVPAGLVGGGDLLPIHTRIPKRNVPVVVACGKPFELSQFYGKKLTPEMVDEATGIIHSAVAHQLAIAREEHSRLRARIKR